LVPGLAGGYELLGPLARLLARNFRVLSFQLRGEEEPFALRRRFDLGDLVDDLTEFLDWHGLERPAVLGVSFGGVLAFECAARFPHRFGRLVVQGAGAWMERGLLQQVAGFVLSQYPLPPNSPFINQFFNLLFGSKQRPDPLFDFVTRQCWQTDQSVMAHRFRIVEQFNLLGRIGRIQAPTLLLVGDRDLLVSERSLKALRADVPSVELVRLRGCGHLAFATHAERVAAEVQRFLQD
jgi:pimeloyl-ACP methyl ester carboxylesterase